MSEVYAVLDECLPAAVEQTAIMQGVSHRETAAEEIQAATGVRSNGRQSSTNEWFDNPHHR